MTQGDLTECLHSQDWTTRLDYWDYTGSDFSQFQLKATFRVCITQKLSVRVMVLIIAFLELCQHQVLSKSVRAKAERSSYVARQAARE